ncbi:adhesion G-protein coupled receptor G4-like isoform X1 [Solea senegalensis]|nr:adhesion G-protein coupled receptor G4 [Solea senegalensis]XP_043896875.1 adhesion G-protein coupled receptor G4 [Solea senegalensis]KAG7518985.1 adhesion G-protein coupled receptor G4-like isoform X1 [Solea senegalensis]
MDSRSFLIICVCTQLSVCLLGSTAGTSLWGKKVQFFGRPCLCQLQPDAAIPALSELRVCMVLRRSVPTQWTGFVYKAPGFRHIELGLQGTSTQMTTWLFGERQTLEWELKINKWYSVCLTWSGTARRLKVYINGTILHEAPVAPSSPQKLTPRGTLTLGGSHFVGQNGDVQLENGNNLMGDIGQFGMWSRVWSAEDLQEQSCADGDVVSWDLRQWKNTCPVLPDDSLHCAWPFYKIQMWIFAVPTTDTGECPGSVEEVTLRHWLQSILPHNIAVHDISVSSPSHDCHVVNNSAALHVSQQPQGSRTCRMCFSSEIYVNAVPAAAVEAIQANITALLSLTFTDNFLNLTADPGSISIHPVELLPAVTEPPPTTVSTSVTTLEPGPTQSLPAPPTDMSTTRDPADINETAVRPDTFFRVHMNLSMTGSPRNPEEIIVKWVKDTLEKNNTMRVLNLIIKDKDGRNMGHNNGRTMPSGQQKEYYCIFQIQDCSSKSFEQMFIGIVTSLTSKYENGSVTIETKDVVVRHIMPESCSESTTSTIYGEYVWPETFPQVTQVMGCKKPKAQRAYRLCELDIETDTTRWAEPDMSRCDQLVTISDLENITVTTDNAAEVVEIIQSLVDVQLGKSPELSLSELESVVAKLNEVIDISAIDSAVGSEIINIIADILLSKTDMRPVANMVLNLTETMGDNMIIQSESESVTAPSLAISMVNADAENFKGLTFGVSSISPLLVPQTFLNHSYTSGSQPDTVATVSLPSALQSFFRGNRTRVQFQFHGTMDLFQDPHITNVTQSSCTLNSYIVSASINNSHVIDLSNPVLVTLRNNKPKQPEDSVRCMFWDFAKNGGQGGWSGKGCETFSNSSYQTSCLCDHLTHFAVLLDVSRTPIDEANSHILTVISYLGCGISSIFLGITLLTYLGFEKLRRDYPSKILVNLSFSLLGLSMLFLLDSWLSSFSNYGLCIATGAALHYFLLASFTWMGLEAVHMYLALVKVFNTYVPSYILKFCAAGWGIPLVIVSLVLAIDKDAYGDTAAEEAKNMDQTIDQFCWLQNDVFFYVTVVAFVLLILLCNISVFIVVLIQIRRLRSNKTATYSSGFLHDLRAVASLTVLLGLTWIMGFFSFGPGRVVMMYLFSIFNTLQGFFVFVFHCLMKENVRKQWRIHLCCGPFRLSDYSDWSRSATVGGHCRKNNLINSDTVASNNTCSTRKVSDFSTNSAANHHHQRA